jgi:endoglucanase
LLDESALALLTRLLETPSPTGFEQPVQRILKAYAEPLSDRVRSDVQGNLIALKHVGGRPRVLLDAHCDQIGLIVQHIDKDGFLYVQPLGGWDVQILLGQAVAVHTRTGPVPGVIARKPKHLLTVEEAKKVPEIHELWVDIGAAGKEEAERVVGIGDPVTPRLGMTRIANDFAFGAKMDDSVGLFVIFEALKRIQKRPLAAEVHVVSAVQEEIGLRGAQTAAFGVDPDVAVAVDVTHATDCPTIDKRANGEIRLGAGPVIFRGPNINPKVFERLMAIATEGGLPIQVKAAARGLSNDANAIQQTRAGVAVGCLGIPNRYMHSPVEMVSLRDLDVAAELLAGFLVSLSPDDDFTPTA